MMDKVSLRKKQIEVVTAMLNLNAQDWQPDWKFLIYDSIGENILAPLFSVQELKMEHSVVSHMLINSNRDPVPDVSAIYFVMPNDDNIDRICSDLTAHLHDSYYFNFISPLSRAQLESIADAALRSSSADDVKKVYDQYLNYITLEDDLFILRERGKETVSYFALNRNDVSDSEITQVIDRIVDGLFSVFVTLNVIPVIRCPRGGASEAVAEKLTKRIRETLRDQRTKLFDNKDSRPSGSLIGSTIQRPLLCLVDRTIDMSTPLHHTWTYQALIHDLFDTELNKVKITENTGNKSKPKLQVFDLSLSDKLWKEHKASPFPQVAEAVQKELDEYKKHEQDLTTLGPKNGSNDLGDDVDSIAESTAKLVNAAGSVQELLENKRVIENHTTIATAVLDEIKARKLDNFFEIEEKIMNRNLIDRATLDEMLSSPDYGHPSDKYRLFLISYICDNPNLTEDEAEKYINTLEGMGCKRTAFEYIKRWKTFSKVSVASLQSSLQTGGGVLKTANMFSKLMSQGSQFVMEGVKNLVLKEHHLPLTKIVDNLMDSSSKVSQEASEFCYFDPKAQTDNAMPRKKVFQEAIVFVVGGANYVEYQNLMNYSRDRKSSIIYGSTDLMNSNQFLEQLVQLGAI